MSISKSINCTDNDSLAGINSYFRCAVKCITYHYHISFLEICKSFNVTPFGLKIEKKPFISFTSHEINAVWKDVINSTQHQLLETLIYGIHEKLSNFEVEFWKGVLEYAKEVDMEALEGWFVGLYCHLEKEEKEILKRKRKKLCKLILDPEKRRMALDRLKEHKGCLLFKSELLAYCESIFEDFENLVNIVTVSGTSKMRHGNGNSFINDPNETQVLNETNLSDTSIDFEISTNDTNKSTNVFLNNNDNRLSGVFVSPNVFNLSKRQLSKAEISLLSKGLKFVPTPDFVNRALLKEELEKFGRFLRLKWFYRNEESTGVYNLFRPKSKFNPKGKDAAIEIYLSRLEEEILALDTRLSYSNLTREERQAIKSLKEDPNIVIKSADKGSAVVVWDREDYLQEASNQLGDTSTYEEVFGDCVSPLIATIQDCLLKISSRGDVPKQTMEYFLVDNPRLGRFYLLPKIHKRLHSVPGRPVISNSGYFTENISAFVDIKTLSCLRMLFCAQQMLSGCTLIFPMTKVWLRSIRLLSGGRISLFLLRHF